MCGIVVVLPVYDARRLSAAPDDPQRVADVLPEVPPAGGIRPGVPDTALLGQVDQALERATELLREPAVMRIVGDPGCDTSAVEEGRRLAEWTADVEPSRPSSTERPRWSRL